MKMNKRNSLLTAVLLLAGANVYSIVTSPFPFQALPADLRKDITIILMNNEISTLPRKNRDSIDIVAKKIKDLCVVNKEFERVINESNFTLQLIKDISKTFDCSNYYAASRLETKGAQARLALQDSLEYICKEGKFSMSTFEQLYKKGVDLEWIDASGETPLYRAVHAGNLDAVNALIKKRVNVSDCKSSNGKPVLADFIELYRGAHFVEIAKALIDGGANLEIGFSIDDAYSVGEKRNPELVKQMENVFKLIEAKKAKK